MSGSVWQTNLQILVVVVGTLGVYTLVANSIPQVRSEVPEELSFSGEVDPAELVAAGQELFEGAGGCTACHGLGTRAPNLLSSEGGTGPIGARCSDRVEGEDCKTYLHRAMVDPQAYVVEGYNPIMPDMRRTLSDTQIWAIIAYLQDQGGEVTVTANDLASAEEEAGQGEQAGGETEEQAGSGGAQPAAGGTDPVALLENNLCLSCHTLDDRGVELGPSFNGIGARVDADYIRRSILEPNAEASEGYEQLVGSMPTSFGEVFTAAQLEAIVQYLAERR